MYHHTRTRIHQMPVMNQATPSLTAYHYLINVLSQSNDQQIIIDILAALLTDKEQSELSNRIQIFTLLQQGLPQREISERLGVGIATVSRGAKAYQQHQIDNLLPDLANQLKHYASSSRHEST